MADDTKSKISDKLLDEVKKLSQKAEEIKETGKQLGLGIPDEDEASPEDQLDEHVLKDMQRPEEAHNLYYALRGVLMGGLPEGKENKKLRQFVYDEKNIYLNRGKDLDKDGIRGSDGRQAYLHHLRVALSTAKQWAKAEGTAWDIFMEYWNLNEEDG